MKHRTQFDGLGDKISADTALDFTGAVDVTRQEFQKETDVNYILKRYGMPNPAQGKYGEQFATVDLQRAIELQQQLQNAWHGLPEPLRARYGSWGSLIAAADSGELSADDLRVVDAAQNEAVTPPSDTPEKS